MCAQESVSKLENELDNYFIINPQKSCTLSFNNKLPVMKPLDSFYALQLIKPASSINPSHQTYCASTSLSKRIVYYGKNPVILKASKTPRKNYEYTEEYYCPLAMIFDINKLLENELVETIYPFDPTKFKNSAGLTLDDLRLKSKLFSINKYIVCFFGDIINYQHGYYCNEFLECINDNPPQTFNRIFAFQNQKEITEKN